MFFASVNELYIQKYILGSSSSLGFLGRMSLARSSRVHDLPLVKNRVDSIKEATDELV